MIGVWRCKVTLLEQRGRAAAALRERRQPPDHRRSAARPGCAPERSQHRGAAQRARRLGAGPLAGRVKARGPRQSTAPPRV